MGYNNGGGSILVAPLDNGKEYSLSLSLFLLLSKEEGNGALVQVECADYSCPHSQGRSQQQQQRRRRSNGSLSKQTQFLSPPPPPLYFPGF